jgi:hypothetical protein
MLLYLIWATRSTAGSPCLHQRQTYNSPEAIEACTKSLACFTDQWSDALPYLKVFEFLQQIILWDSDTAAPGTDIVDLEEAEVHLERLKGTYLHRAILGMIEDMMYGGAIRYETLTVDLMTGIP